MILGAIAEEDVVGIGAVFDAIQDLHAVQTSIVRDASVRLRDAVDGQQNQEERPWLGRDAVFVLNALSFLGSAFLIRRMKFAEPHADGLPPLRGRELVTFAPILEGLGVRS